MTLAHICFRVADLARAVDFYVEKLGFSHAFDFKHPDGKRYGVYLKISGRTFIELFEKADVAPMTDKQSYAHICLEVEDINTAVALLRGKGVTVSDPKLGLDQSWQAWISDPDGNRIELHAYTEKSWQAPWLS
ncbi:MAG: VOC family protein [Spirochaetota bacterium]